MMPPSKMPPNTAPPPSPPSSPKDDESKYLTFAPRGLQQTVISKLQSTLQTQLVSISILEDESYNEVNYIQPWKNKIEKEETKRRLRRERKKLNPRGSHQSLLLKSSSSSRKEANNKTTTLGNESITETNTVRKEEKNQITKKDVVGSTSLSDGTNVNVGYYTPPSSSSSSSSSSCGTTKSIWSMPGQTEGLVPIIFTTTASYIEVATIRGMGCGPLLALVTTTAPITLFTTKEEEEETTGSSSSPKAKKQKISSSSSSSSSSSTLEMSYKQSVEQATSSITSHFQSQSTKYQEDFNNALHLWYNHCINVWYHASDPYFLFGQQQQQERLQQDESFKEEVEEEEKENDVIKRTKQREVVLQHRYAHIQNKTTTTKKEKIIKKNKALKYRISCVRAQGKKYSYKKEDLLPELASTLLPSTFFLEEEEEEKEEEEEEQKMWDVDLVNFDLEIVLFMHTSPPNDPLLSKEEKEKEEKRKNDKEKKQEHYLTIGLNLRPYNQYSSASSSSSSSSSSPSPSKNRSWYTTSHLPPPDILPPFLSLSSFRTSDKLVKLRPSTSQLLLEMAELKMGDVVLDPCAGVGTIPVEVGLGEKKMGGKEGDVVVVVPVRCVGLGGDVVLHRQNKEEEEEEEENDVRCTARGYLSSAQQYKKYQNSQTQCNNNNNYNYHYGPTELLGWDASLLPLKNSCVDVIVSDLPFGQRCLSTHRLALLIPLILYEMARVLRCENGRMVLLCGSFSGIVEGIEELNARCYHHHHHHHQQQQHEEQLKKDEKKHVTQVKDINQNDAKLLDDDNNNNNNSSSNSKHQVFETPLQSIFPVNIGGLSAWIIVARRGNGKAIPPSSNAASHLDRVKKLASLRERQRKHEQSALLKDKQKRLGENEG